MFRKMDLKRLQSGVIPTETFKRSKLALLHSFSAAAQAFVVISQTFTDEELQRIGLTHANIAAYAEELEQSIQEELCDQNDSALAAIKAKVFSEG